jgi:hypothetical protein
MNEFTISTYMPAALILYVNTDDVILMGARQKPRWYMGHMRVRPGPKFTLPRRTVWVVMN